MKEYPEIKHLKYLLTNRLDKLNYLEINKNTFNNTAAFIDSSAN